jgi:hypothetical protein
VALLKTDLPRVEKASADADAMARKALSSHHDLEGSNQELWRSVLVRLDEQDKERDRLEADKKSREQASIAAQAKVSADRDFRLKMATIAAPIAIAAISLAGILYSTWATTKSHEDTNAKFDLITKEFSAPRRFDNQYGAPIGTSVAVGSPPVESTPASAPAATPVPAQRSH